MAIAKVGDSVFFPGIDQIVNDFHAEQVIPAQAEINPAQVPACSLLDELFALDDLHASILKSLQPQVFDPVMLLPAEFSAILLAMPRRLQELAQAWPHTARICGQAAYMLNEELHRRGQAWECNAALRQV
ncbi:type III secretion apparatus assembly protein SctX [Noviherbaspirillum pedocola]|uniref:Uncharacterized protein n=1 Tax=Noviherbaspirillum pedocola TaxID=2801341 RepID=A0A934W3U9_9BURK|nr:hypothetical protein [Noviherbaspirillum pedocola]MBK4733227.1 hypothetical protein [Noviherbaspirillum pedocola]